MHRTGGSRHCQVEKAAAGKCLTLTSMYATILNVLSIFKTSLVSLQETGTYLVALIKGHEADTSSHFYLQIESMWQLLYQMSEEAAPSCLSREAILSRYRAGAHGEEAVWTWLQSRLWRHVSV